MTAVRIEAIPDEQVTVPDDGSGIGALRTGRGNLPLRRIAVRATITGLSAGIELTQVFHNGYPEPLEATYVFPLPDRAAVTRMTVTAGDRQIDGVLRERGAAREEYRRAVAAGQRAGIAEEERPDVFTLRVGNILPGEDVTVSLGLAGPMSFVDEESEFRFPLVVAPRYIPGAPLPGGSVGDGHAPDTDLVPDASRITPPVLLPGFPNPVDLSIRVHLDPAGPAPTRVASSLHAVTEADGVISIRPGERVNRDFILRLSYRDVGEGTASAGHPVPGDALILVPDRDGSAGTWQLTLLPPPQAAPPRPRDVVLVLDRSGSMSGWKMVAARRAAARIVDTLVAADRFAVLTFDDRIEWPAGLPAGLVPASDRNRYRAVEHLGRTEARGGTELLAPLREVLALLTDAERDRVLVLVTDGQVGNEDHILRETTPALSGVRTHTVGIDRAVNAGFLNRLASAGGGRCELVESEGRLDTAMDRIHQRIGSPLVTLLDVIPDSSGGPTVVPVPGDTTPARAPHLFPGAPLTISGRYHGDPAGAALVVTGLAADGNPWRRTLTGSVTGNPAVTAIWARGHLRDLEDRYAVDGGPDLEGTIVATSLRHGVLCRFTAYVAIDHSVVTDGAATHRVIQPVEPVAGWAESGLDMIEAERTMGYYRATGPMTAMVAPDAASPAPPAVANSAAPMSPSPMSAGSAASMSAGSPMSAARRRSVPRGGFAAGRFGGGVVPGAGPDKPQRAAFDLPPEQVPPYLRRLAVRQVELLRATTGQPDGPRRELLGDLIATLESVISRMRDDGDAGTGPVQDLIDALRDDTVPVADRWARALAAMEALAGVTEEPSVQPARSMFWKR